MAIPHLDLNTGTKIPAIGFGTWQLEEGNEAQDSVEAALEAGYRLLDTARIYGNEKSVGRAVNESEISRAELFVTTKLWTGDFTAGEQAFSSSLDRLGMDFVDLYLLHWPDGSERHQAWDTLSGLYKQGKAKAVGISNFMVGHLEELFTKSGLIPAVNQIEFHPFNYRQQKPVLDLCKDKGIVVEAYSPLARGRQMENKTIANIASAHNKTSAQVMLRWAIQHGTVPIPKSATPGRIKQNLEVFDFELTGEDMASLNNLS